MATLSTLTFFCEILSQNFVSDISKGVNVHLHLQGLNVHEPDCAGIWPDQLFVFFTFWKEFVSVVLNFINSHFTPVTVTFLLPFLFLPPEGQLLRDTKHCIWPFGRLF